MFVCCFFVQRAQILYLSLPIMDKEAIKLLDRTQFFIATFRRSGSNILLVLAELLFIGFAFVFALDLLHPKGSR